ncbi:hypothetical protein [Albidovulum salinarum]|uniref:hypothetical protein n=1 Tax=Albidovulum salinarum TaxID=2984153 RepID=UPI0021E04C83|nr:hypothetical protein [Defluviimonas sp. WL0024]
MDSMGERVNLRLPFPILHRAMMQPGAASQVALAPPTFEPFPFQVIACHACLAFASNLARSAYG